MQVRYLHVIEIGYIKNTWSKLTINFTNIKNRMSSSQSALGINNDPKEINNKNNDSKQLESSSKKEIVNNSTEVQPSAPPAISANNIQEKISDYVKSDYAIWMVGNGIIFNVVFIILLAVGFYYTNISTNMREVSANWAKYRCDPSIMPFASLYGYNTAENFNYCMGGVFNTFSADATSSFTDTMGSFTGILSSIGSSIDGLRTTAATMGGGINVMFQDFTDRITNFFFRLRLSAIRIKLMMSRLYTILFSIMYMGSSGLVGMSTFTNTALFSFVDDISCFPPWQKIQVKGRGPVYMTDVKVGDILEGGQRVNGVFRFYAKGQPMVKLDDILVSNNHYILSPVGWIKAEDHSDAVVDEPWSGRELICLNTDDHTMNIGKYTFRDFDETNEAHYKTMNLVEQMINGKSELKNKSYREYTPSIHPDTKIKLYSGEETHISNISIGTRLSTGGYVIGLANREVSEIVEYHNIKMAASTLVWSTILNKWIRIGDICNVIKLQKPEVYKAFLITPNSQIELSTGDIIRDYIEIASADIEVHYSNELGKLKNMYVNVPVK